MMFRWMAVLLLVVYVLLPIIAIALMVVSVQQIQSNVEPALTTAREAIDTASTALDFELRSMGRNIQPVVDTLNGMRAGLEALAAFASGPVNVLVDTVNNLTNNAFSIPRFEGISLPEPVDLSFISRIAVNIDVIGGQVATVSTVVAETVNEQMQLLTLAIVLLVGWMVLSFLLLGLTMFLTLWRER